MKGQWFIISAAVLVGVLFTISLLFQSYGTARSTQVADLEEAYYFKNLKMGRDDLASFNGDQDRISAEFKDFAETETGKIGILTTVDPSTNAISLQTNRFSATG